MTDSTRRLQFMGQAPLRGQLPPGAPHVPQQQAIDAFRQQQMMMDYALQDGRGRDASNLMSGAENSLYQAQRAPMGVSDPRLLALIEALRGK